MDDHLDYLDENEKLDVKLQITNEAARSRHSDYDQTVNDIMPKIKNDDALMKQVLSADDPAQAAYDLGKEADSLDSMFADQKY